MQYKQSNQIQDHELSLCDYSNAYIIVKANITVGGQVQNTTAIAADR